MGGDGGFGRGRASPSLFVLFFFLLALLPVARATTCARAIYAPAVALPGTSFWAVAQFDDEGANLSPAACAGRGADCGLFSAFSAAAAASNSTIVALPPLQGFPSLARASIARVRLLVPLSARSAMINVTLARPACGGNASSPSPPLSALVSPASLLPARPPVLSIARAPSLVDATFDVRLDFPDRVAWLDPRAVLVNSSSVALAEVAAAASSPALAFGAANTTNSTTNSTAATTATNRTRPSSPPPPTPPSLPALMALAAGARVAMAVRPRGDADAAAGTALVLTVDGATPGQMVQVQVPSRAFAGPGGVTGATNSSTAQNSTVLAVRIPGPSSLLPGLAVLSGRLLPSALGVSAGVCAAAAILAPGSYVATVTCGSGGLLRSLGHAQVAAALGAALSSPAFGLAPSVAAAANGLRWSMLQWLPATFNGPFATFLAGWAVDVEEKRREQHALKLAAEVGPLAAADALAREAEALRVVPVAAVTRNGAWSETIGAAPLEMIAADGLVRDIAIASSSSGVGAGAPSSPSPPQTATTTTSALADPDTAAELDAWLWDMQLGGQRQLNGNSSNSTISGSGVLSFAVANPLPPPPSDDAASAAAYLSPRALASRQALPSGAWVLEPDTPEGERRRAALAAAWVAFLGAAEVAGAAMFGACLLHAASAAASAGDGGALSQQPRPASPSPLPPEAQTPPHLLLPPPPRILASLPVGPPGRRRDPNLARRAIRNNAMLMAAAAAAEEEEEDGAAARDDGAHQQQQQADLPPPPPLPSPPLFVWPKVALLVAVASWPPLVHLSCGLLPGGGPAWQVAAAAGPLALLGLAAAAWMLLWSTRRGARGLLRPSVLLDAQATSKMVAGAVDEDVARCRELEQEDEEDAEEEEERQRQRRRPPSSLRPPEPSSFSPRMTTCTITEIRHPSASVGFAARPSNGRGQLLMLQPQPSPSPSPSRSPSPSPPTRSRSPSPPTVAERLLPFVPPSYYAPTSSPSGATTTAVTLLRPVLRLPSSPSPPPPREMTTATPPPPQPSRSPALLQLSAPRHQQRRRARSAGVVVDDDNDDDDDDNDDAMELASVAAAAAASARFVASTGIAPPAPPAPLPLLLRAQQQQQQQEDDQRGPINTARQASDALLQARLVAYAGAAGPLLADVVGPVVGVDDDNAQQQEQHERALQSRAAPAFIGANALAFIGTLLVCGLAGLLGATSARPPLDAVGAAASAVVGVGVGPAAAFASSSASLVTAGVWVLLPLRVVWAVFATQAYASASAAIFEALCTACEVGLLIVAAVSVPVLRGGGSGSPQAKGALTVAALILLLVLMILLTAGEAVRALIVLFEAGGVKCWGGRRRRQAALPSPSPSASARVVPSRRPF